MIDIISELTTPEIDAHSSIVLTYSIDVLLYDGLLRRRLAQAGAANQVVFCDFRKYQEQIDALGAARRLGRSYSLTPIHQTAAFHPKLYMVLGRKGGRLLVASANATIGGLLRNAETIGLFRYDREQESAPHPAFRECFTFIEAVAREAPEVVQRQLSRARSWTPWLDAAPASDHRTVLFGGRGQDPLLTQIRARIGKKAVREILVCTASVDRQLDGLRQLTAVTAPPGRVRCVVQPDQIRIDGEAVKRLGKTITWFPFVDPYPSSRKRRRDSFAHAKFLVFDVGAEEIFVYGSANASFPALLDPRGNTEIVVLFEPWKRGMAIRRLGLEPSLKRGDIGTQLRERSWAEEDADETQECPILLTAAVPSADGVRLRLARSPSIPLDAVLELYESPRRAPLLKGKVAVKSLEPVARLSTVPEAARVARLTGPDAEPLSNFVGITWPEVATARSSSGVHARTEAAFRAMQDGVVLGTVLFELLDHVRDFEIVRGPGQRRSTEGPTDEDSNADVSGSPESFYTDETPKEANARGWVGDRTDLDLLAALVQPLHGGSHAKRKSTEDDDDPELDDSALAEEEERRGIDEKGGSGSGEERGEAPSLTSKETILRAARRLQRRLDRAATAAEEALAHKTHLSNIPASALARQIWMTHIAAFLAGREIPTTDGDDVVCLEAIDFAGYTLRLCRALAGGKDGGLLALVSEKTFAGPDGDSLKRGLSFLWTCAVLAVAETADYWSKAPGADVEEDSECADGLWDAVPELIAARFVLAIRPHCRKADLNDVEVRLPAWSSRADGRFGAWKRRIDRLAKLIEKYEGAARPRQARTMEPLMCGRLVHHPAMGVTVLMRQSENRKYHLLDLSRHSEEDPDRMSRIFLRDQIVPIPIEKELDGWVWREPYWQADR